MFENTGGQFHPLEKSNKNCLNSSIVPINSTLNEITQTNRRRRRRKRKRKRAKELKPNIDQIKTILRELWDLYQNYMISIQRGSTGKIWSDADNRKLIHRTWKFAKTLLNLFCTPN